MQQFIIQIENSRIDAEKERNSINIADLLSEWQSARRSQVNGSRHPIPIMSSQHFPDFLAADFGQNLNSLAHSLTKQSVWVSKLRDQDTDDVWYL